MWAQKIIQLPARRRGFHLITDEVCRALPELAEVATGLLHLFCQHTSASLSINENADPSVRQDFERWFNRAVPDGAPWMSHILEGSDDMPAHIKSSLLGCTVTVPVGDGRLLMGTWQGIYFCEHRNEGGPRKIVATQQGARRSSQQP